MTTASTTNVIIASRFSLTVDGYEIGVFTELSGVTAEVEPSEYWETGTDETTTSKLPGKIKPPTVTLKRGMTGSLELWAWHEAVRQGAMGAARKSCSLTILNSEGKAVAKYWLENAWPSKMDVSGLKAGSSVPLMETVTLTCENIQRVAP
jgi:phage tail-like protein